MNASHHRIGYLFLTLAMIGVSSTLVASKVIADALPPFTATALRFAIASPVLLCLVRGTRTRWPMLTAPDIALLICQAAAGSVGYTVFLIFGLRFASAADAGVITGCLPAVTGMMAVLLLGERPTRRLVISLALATAGVIAIVVKPGGSADRLGVSIPSLTGDALILCAVVSESVFLLLNKRLRKPVPPLVLATLMSLFGLLISAIPAAFELHDHALHGRLLDAFLAVAYYALVPTVAGFFFWYEGARRTTGADAALFTAVLPIGALALAALILSEPIGPRELLGAGCVIAAVLIGAMRSVGREREAAEPQAPTASGSSETSTGADAT
jgi:drug/metabolite transporter (DMT)-like permease